MHPIELYVANNGDDNNPGTKELPFATLHRAKAEVRWIQLERRETAPITVWVRGGTYYLAEPPILRDQNSPLRMSVPNAPLIFDAQDSGIFGHPVTYAAYPGETPVISGGYRLQCEWEPYRDGIFRCRLPEVLLLAGTVSQLFVNGKRQIRARYPNYDPSDPKRYTGYILPAGKIGDDIIDPVPGPNDDMTFSGSAPRGIVFDPETFTQKRWANPDKAVIHIYQAHYWGNLQWRIKAIDWEKNLIWFGDGGHQIGAQWHDAPCDVNETSYFFVENVLEELDVPGEWCFDLGEGTGYLYYMPPADVDLASAIVEIPLFPSLLQFAGTQVNPVHDITVRGFHFTHTTATYLEPYVIPSLSDWAIHRGGAIFLEGAHNCRIEECFFDAVGGNAVFMNNHNRDNVVRNCKFTETGDSAICFVGSLESTVGTQRNFPYECRAENNLIHDCGVFGKQIAGVYISRAKRITAAHNEIFNMPRAGICIGDGTWGGHLIEYNYIHDTCRETGDHGPFNAWGRDKYWCLVQSHMPYTAGRSHDAGHVKIDAMEPVILRYNFFRESSGWGLDLDDGASNYEIYNNLCVGVSMKLREGAYRTIYNNIWVNGANSPCFHVGNEENHDRYFCNITVVRVGEMQPEDDLNFEMGKGYGEIYTLIAPPAHSPWLEEIDRNCFYSDLGEFVARVQQRGESDDWQYSLLEGEKLSLEEWQALGFDRHSAFADPLFVDPERNDYRVRPDSPALALGFRNFDMTSFGLTTEFPKQWRA